MSSIFRIPYYRGKTDPQFVHENQIDAAVSIMEQFLNGQKWVILLAQPQTGKTGVMTQINNYIYDEKVMSHCNMNKTHMIVICGMSSTELKSQTQGRMRTGPGENYVEVLFNQDLQRILGEPKRLEKYKKKNENLIIIIDESHYGQNIDSIVDMFLKNILYDDVEKAPNDIIDYTKWSRDKTFILSVSATPFSELEDSHNHIVQVGRTVLQPGQNYYGILNYHHDHKIRRPYDLRNSRSCRKFFDDNLEILRKKGYVIIRVPNRLKTRNITIDNIKKIGSSYIQDMTFSNYTSNKSDDEYIKDLNDHISAKPDNPNVIFVVAKLRAGYTLNTDNVSVIHENLVVFPKCDVVVQSLLGRCCGYGKNTDILICCDYRSVEKYCKFVEANYDTNVPDTGKNLTGRKEHPTTNKELFTTDRTAEQIIDMEDIDIEDDQYLEVTDEDIGQIKLVVKKRDEHEQHEFRLGALRIYGEKCAVSGKRSKTTLEAAHIIPFNVSHNYDLENCILLSTEIHQLFDSGHLSINPDTLCVELSASDDTFAREEYEQYNNKKIILPEKYEHGIKENLKQHYTQFKSTK
jgi:hypothetical protein